MHPERSRAKRMSEHFNIEEELKKLPAKPGVYLMHNALGEVIYVGKAIRLSNRVRQYFQSAKNKTAKILKMVENIDWFEYIITDSELEALVLECNLIKEYRPRYNTMLMDDKGYPFIRVTVEEDYPRVFKVHSMKKDKSRYFGPYTSNFAVNETLDLLHKIFKIRTCSRVLPRDFGKERPCLNFYMGRCQGPCRGNVEREEYGKSIDGILRFLSGEYQEIMKDLENKMQEASDNLEFEEAIRYRELLESVRHVSEKQKITDTGSSDDRDVIAGFVLGKDAVVQVFFIRDGKLLGRDHFHMECEEGTALPEILENFVKQFYAGTPFVPKEILLQEEISDHLMIEKWLSEKRGKKTVILVPKRGEKEKLMELAARNAENILKKDREKILLEEKKTRGALSELSGLLNVGEINRMEAFDISNISGFESVGSMVVFENGKPKKNDYRKFRIRSVSGPDDYASMEEVLGRRFRHGLSEPEGAFSVFPDIIMMDGGKGQVHVAEAVLKELGLSIPVCGMVKDDHHNTRGLYFRDEELSIDRHSECFHMITRLQDEAHRFAITYHRGLHTKNSIHSALSDIPGVGPKREKALMRRFGSMEEIRDASLEEIASIDEFNLKAAEEVYAYLHPVETREERPDRRPEETSDGEKA